MDVGRLAWRTPTGAMLWEIWGRHKWQFLLHWVALVLSVVLVYWREHGAPEIARPGLGAFALGSFGLAYLHLLTCFGYIEVDGRTVRLGYPGRLLFKPVSTIRLVLTPMLFGGLAMAAVFVLWKELVVQRVGPVSDFVLLWVGVILLSFFWWVQALSWALPTIPGRAIIELVVAVIHLLVGLLPLVPSNPLSSWEWPILCALLLCAIPFSWLGLQWMRQGDWEGPWRTSGRWRKLSSGLAGAKRKKFRSAFAAQFWLEWQRQGWLLPGISAVIAFVAVPAISIGFKNLAAEPPRLGAILTLLLATPLVLSGLVASTLAKFDPIQPPDELPIYIAIRPMSDGSFVMAKLAMALGSSALTWVVTAAGACLCVALLGNGSPIISSGASGITSGPLALVIGCTPMFLLLIILTWKNLVAGIGAGLTGRRWIIVLFGVWRFAIFIVGLLAIAIASSVVENFRDIVWHWLPGILIGSLAMKIAVTVVVLVYGLRRNVISARWIGLVVGGWLVCGLFIAGYAGLVCRALDKSEIWIWIAIGGFLAMPVADLAIAPLALAWNRHR